jgi:hypothetical protein
LPAVDEEAGDPTVLEMLCDPSGCFRSRATGVADKRENSPPRIATAFASTLAHEVVYQNLLLRRRTALHQRAGRCSKVCSVPVRRGWKTSMPCATTSVAGEDQARGARYLAAAGDWARGIYANEDALRYYARALAILRNGGPPDDQAVVGIHEHMGDCWARSVAAMRLRCNSTPS